MFVIPLVSCRTGVPDCRVPDITLMMWVRIALSLTREVAIIKVLAAPNAVLTMALLGPPLIGIGLLASTDLLIDELLDLICLLIGIPLLGCMCMWLLMWTLVSGILDLELLLVTCCVAEGVRPSRFWTVLLAAVCVSSLNIRLSRASA